jgi:diguanylate cyclase (GGDEF)-like protein
MSIITFGCNTSRLKALVGIRARLILLALILVAPLMLDRVRVLEENRAKQVHLAGQELSQLAKHTADAQREIILTAQAVLKSSAYIYGAAANPDQGCTILRASMRVDLPWIRSLSVLNKNGKVDCSTMADFVGMDLHDREYFTRAMNTSAFVVSDYIFARKTNLPTIVAAYPVSNFITGKQGIIIAAIDLKWMSQILANRGERADTSALLVDGDGVVLAARPGSEALIGQQLKDTSLLDAVAAREINLDSDEGSINFNTAEGEKQVVSFARVEGTRARMIVSTNEAQMLGDIDRSIRTAYAQFALVILVALLGAWIVGERLIIHPVQMMADLADRFGRGDLAPHRPNAQLPREFVPLLEAFNRMAEQLAERERDLVATNNRLTVMASIDMVSGLANRRGFKSRLDFEWLKAEQSGDELSLIMIDVDHFKLFNDTYGHPEGDACLNRVGEALSMIATQVLGFAARYGGEEFCMLLPGMDSSAALGIGETIRATVQRLAIVHGKSTFNCVTVSAGVAVVRPSEAVNAQELIDAADAALYAAKRRGRNNVVSHALIRTDDHGMSMAS